MQGWSEGWQEYNSKGILKCMYCFAPSKRSNSLFNSHKCRALTMSRKGIWGILWIPVNILILLAILQNFCSLSGKPLFFVQHRGCHVHLWRRNSDDNNFVILPFQFFSSLLININALMLVTRAKYTRHHQINNLSVLFMWHADTHLCNSNYTLVSVLYRLQWLKKLGDKRKRKPVSV